MQIIVDQLVAWGHTLGSTLNPTKTVSILFTRATEKTIKFHHRKLHINEEVVEFSQDTRYLGIQIDSKLTWNLHLDMVIKKAKQYLCIVVAAHEKSW